MSNPYQPPGQDPSEQPYRRYGEERFEPNPYEPTPYDPDPYGQGRRAEGPVQPYQPGYGPVGGDHPQAVPILVLGIAGFFVGVTAPVAWVLGNRALREIRESGVRARNEQLIVVGRILGIVATVLAVLGILLGVLLVVLAAVAATQFD